MKVEFIDQPIRNVLSIRTVANMNNLPNLIGNGYAKIGGYLNELKEEIKEVPFVAYYSIDPENMDVEIGFPISRVLPGRENINASTIPAGKYADYMFKGPYKNMESVYGEIFNQIKQNGYEPTGVYYEYYYNGPDEVSEDELLTKISIQLK